MITAYHGSINMFDKFEINESLSNPIYNGDDKGLGIFFTDNLIMAKTFANLIDYNTDSEDYEELGNTGYIYTASFEFHKPLIIDEISNFKYEDAFQKYVALIDKIGGVKIFREKLLEEGYDGIIIKKCTTNYYYDDSYDVYVVLNPETIRIDSIVKY